MDRQLDSCSSPLRCRGPELPVTSRLTILDIADIGH
jgi:hypothetical protein